MKNYYRLMLGKKHFHAAECFAGSFIGVDLSINQDLAGKLPEEWREFNKEFIPVWLVGHPGKSKIAAGLACGALWTVAKGIKNNDIVLCPDGEGNYRACEIIGDYYYVADGPLQHRRAVRWLPQTFERSAMSEALRSSTSTIGTVCQISGHEIEIDRLIGGELVTPIPADAVIEDPTAFMMEKHLEDFLVQNWAQTELGKEYDIFEEDGERVGQQYRTDTGPLDILAISKDKKRLLVVELKKGRASDVVVGQTLRYMGYVQDELAEEGQQVKGAIIALDDDVRIRRALTVVTSVIFYRYQITFKLVKS